MLEIVDRMQIAVRDRASAAKTFSAMLAAEPLAETGSDYLNASRTILSLGQSELELCEPRGPGVAQTHIDRWGEGLMTAGYATSQMEALTARLEGRSARYTRDEDQIYIGPDVTAGFALVISPRVERPRAAGPVSFLYEATNTLESNWRDVATLYADLFDLQPERFSEISNDRFGYTGTLTLFDPPTRLDRIELSQTFADQPTPMRRFVERRGGDSLYMCFAEAHDFDGLKERLIKAGATLATRGNDLAGERDTMWVHPKNLHGLLLGISRAGFAWHWSGRPELVPPRPLSG